LIQKIINNTIVKDKIKSKMSAISLTNTYNNHRLVNNKIYAISLSNKINMHCRINIIIRAQKY